MKSNQQQIDGILLVDKPPELTSNAVLQRVKRLFQAKKAGHTGSLDPMATGMLPICFGEATKFCQYMLDADKCYEATGCLGIKTTTSDAMGEVIAHNSNFSVSTEQLKNVLSRFMGSIEQVPSMYSALKHQGVPLYKFARAGQEIERKARAITVHTLQLTEFDGQLFKIKVNCSKGTYIRNLIEDIGEQLGVGAHVIQLHRCYTAGFEQEAMYSLEAIMGMSEDERKRCLLPMTRAIQYLPKQVLNDDEVRALRQGKTLPHVDAMPEMGLVQLYDNQQFFIGLGEFTAAGELKVKRLLANHQGIVN